MLTTAANAANPSISVEPSLNVRFQQRVSDYTTTCPDGHVTVRARARRPISVSIDGAEPRSGRVRMEVGLNAGQAFKIAVHRRDRRVRNHFIRCLPADFPEFDFRRYRQPLSELYAVAPSLNEPDAPGSYVIVFSRDGTPVWWYRTGANAVDLKAIAKGVLAWSHIGTPSIPHGFELHALNGEQVGRLTTVGTPTDGHDLQVLPNGDHLLLSYRLRRGVDLSRYGGPADASIFDTEIQQVSTSGELVWRWNSGDHIPLAETGRWWPYVLDHTLTIGNGEQVYDPTHGNSIEPDGKKLLLSLRHTDGVYAISRRTGRITWKLGGTHRRQSLRVRKDPQGGHMFGGQHDARVMPNGTVTVHDNATMRDYAPRAVRYRINARKSTATLVEQVTDPLVDASGGCGSARRYPGGGWLLNWGFNPFTTEFDADGLRTFKLLYGDLFSYRAVPVSPDLLGLRALRRGMTAMAPRIPGG